MADHNDPNSVNSIFSDVEASPADLYDMFGFPAAEPDTVVIASTFAAVPTAGTLDPDLLYRMRVHARERSAGLAGRLRAVGPAALRRRREGPLRQPLRAPATSGRGWTRRRPPT